MRNAICFFLFCLTCGFSFSQLEGFDTRHWPFKLCISTPNVIYNVQHADMLVLKNATNTHLFQNRMRMAHYELFSGACVFRDHYLLGVQTGYSSRKTVPNLQTDIETQNPNFHLLNYREQAHNFFTNRLFAGYQYTFNKKQKYPHVLGLFLYLNFDNYTYGTYSYDAKNVSNNEFFSYSLTTSVKNSKSLTIELQKHRYYQLKDSLKGVNIGVKFGVTPRNQEITITEIKREGTSATQTINANTFDLKSWSVYFGVQFSFVTTPTYYKKKK